MLPLNARLPEQACLCQRVIRHALHHAVLVAAPSPPGQLVHALVPGRLNSPIQAHLEILVPLKPNPFSSEMTKPVTIPVARRLPWPLK